MKRPTPLLVLALLLSAAPGALAQSPGQTEQKTSDVQRLQAYRDASLRLEKARRLFEKKDLEGTKAEVAACLERAPELSEGHLLLAKVLYLEKDYPAALGSIEAAEKSWERGVAVRERMQADRLAALRGRLKEKDDAIADVQVQMARSPGSQQELQARLEQLRTDRREIERILQEAPPTGTEPPAEYAFLHGNVLLRMKQYNDAVMQYHEALRLKPDYAEAANNLASLFYSARRYEQARAVVRSAEAAGASINPELKSAIEAELAKTK